MMVGCHGPLKLNVRLVAKVKVKAQVKEMQFLHFFGILTNAFPGAGCQAVQRAAYLHH